MMVSLMTKPTPYYSDPVFIGIDFHEIQPFFARLMPRTSSRNQHDFQFMKKTLTNGKGPRLLLCQKPISFLFMENICVRALNRAT